MTLLILLDRRNSFLSVCRGAFKSGPLFERDVEGVVDRWPGNHQAHPVPSGPEGCQWNKGYLWDFFLQIATLFLRRPVLFQKPSYSSIIWMFRSCY